MGSIKLFENIATINWINCLFVKKDLDNQINDKSFFIIKLIVFAFYSFLLFTILALYYHNYNMNLYTKILNSHRRRQVFFAK
jgi:hypothetical protein